MKQILKKFRSDAGSSMIIALLFMLICVFVGGSVLVAATVNSGRLNGKRQEQQAILNQRSIISVISNYLTNESGKIDLAMSISKDEAGADTITIPEDSQGIRELIYRSARDTFIYHTENPQDFEVTYADGSGRSEVIRCYVKCTSNYTVYIGFKDSPEVKLKLSANLSSNALRWYDGKIVKDGAAA